MSSAEQELRVQVKAALLTARISQAEIARRLDLSTKHLSHMFTGRAPLTLDWAERILAHCGMRIVIGLQHDTQPR
ncbi:helix-turn-helix transcriptional regulator [Streptomyces sp. NPDC005890]|uniref:helix-turn-helix domain-containing protein n=1 Tax=Streptomyces sp. NPDC005890 TaxID=3154568 RepID=UPI0033EE1DE9